MDVYSISEILKKIPKSFYFPLLLAIFGATLIGYGMIQYFESQSSRENFDVGKFSQATASANLNDSRIFVDIEGAMQKPGVYQMHQGERIQDIFISAGGLTAHADRRWVEQHINLAAPLTDAEKIYIPQEGESVQGMATEVSDGIASGSISVNTASSDQLNSLPGIGQVTAEKIIAGRPYSTLNELVTKKIISQSVFNKIQNQISL